MSEGFDLMTSIPDSASYRSVTEWTLRSNHAYTNPFIDVAVDATFTGPSGKSFTIPGFYDGDDTWRVRFNPSETGQWIYRIVSRPSNADLTRDGTFEVSRGQGHGFLQTTPGRAWGFHYESGEPAFLLGDTTYNRNCSAITKL